MRYRVPGSPIVLDFYDYAAMKSIIRVDALMAVVEGLSTIFGKVSHPSYLLCLSFDSYQVIFNASYVFVPTRIPDPNAVQFDKTTD